MLSYRHLFHAGNFADVFKHALLARLLLALQKKDKPFCYLDTHAGTGRYDLGHAWAQKAREYQGGVARVWQRADAPPLLAPWLEAVRAENPDGRLHFYPGSPLIVRRLLRPGDRMVLSELNKTDCARLKDLFAGDRQVSVHLLDGYQALKAFLPPPERRGLVLLDSSFDRAGEFARIAAALQSGHRRWPTGLFAIWYPLMEPAAMRVFARDVADTGIRGILRLEIRVEAESWGATMPGCGMLLVNPPWQFEDEARPLLDWLAQALGRTAPGRATVDWLVPE